MLIWQDGAWHPAERSCLRPDDGGWLFGDSLFETLLVRGDRALFCREHLDRLQLSAKLLQMPFSRQDCTTELKQALSLLPWPVSRLRLTLSRGAMPGLAFPNQPQGTLLFSASPYQEPEPGDRERGQSGVLAPNRRVNPLSHLPQMKRGNYADCLYARNFARDRGADEALFLSDTGLLLEGATSNLFLIRNGELLTPPVGELILAGVMRRQVLLAAEGLGIPAREADLSPEELMTADEAFLCNSLQLLMPLARFAGQGLNRGEHWARVLARIESSFESAGPPGA